MSCISVTTKAPESCVVAVEYPRMGYVTTGKQETMEVSLARVKHNARIKTKAQELKAKLTLGLVCGSDFGAVLLCGSDGVLITVDGNYLIVRR